MLNNLPITCKILSEILKIVTELYITVEFLVPKFDDCD